MELLSQALEFLKEKGLPLPEGFSAERGRPEGTESAVRAEMRSGTEGGRSELGNWPVQLHLLSPTDPVHAGRDFLLSADCVAFALADFHETLLRGKTLAIACPKLDGAVEIYREKIAALIDQARINTLTVAIMEVPCCRGLLAMVQEARAQARRKIPVQAVVVSTRDGAVLSREWV
jgi:hypothetical protein